jgi:hypothetical protein
MIRNSQLLFAVALLLLAAPAFGQSTNDDFTLSLGIFPTNFGTSAALSSDDADQDPTEVDLENDLGFDNRLSNVRLEGLWRFRPKHRLEFAWTSWRRDTEKVIERQIVWRDKVFDAGVNVSAENNAQFIKLAYHYSLYRTDRTEFDVSGGFDIIWNTTTLAGEATLVGEGGEASRFYEDEYDFVAPAPVIGIGVSHLITPQWLLRGTGEYFTATVDNTTAKVADFRGSVDWLFAQNWAAGLGYNYVGFKVERERFDAQYDFNGPILYFTWRR